MIRKQVLLAIALACGGFGHAAVGNNCGDCVNLAPTGNMMQINTSGQGGLNALNIDWKSSHGSPSYAPGLLWMWSSFNNVGEGVYYEGFQFQFGHTYCITFDTKTETSHGGAAPAGAGFKVIATSSLIPAEIGSGGNPIPTIPSASQSVAAVPWNSIPAYSTTFSYTFTAIDNWSQLWFYPHTPSLDQAVELELQNLRICDVTPVDPCLFEVDFYSGETDNCLMIFHPNFTTPPGLTVAQYFWQFDDGTDSYEEHPEHYYPDGGLHWATLTVLMINSAGQCCSKTITHQFTTGGKSCSPCDLIQKGVFTMLKSCNTVHFFGFPVESPGFAYTWDFGDGSTGIGRSPIHQYASPGGYTVRMTVHYYDPQTKTCCSFTKTDLVRIEESGGGTGQTGLKTTDPAETGSGIPESLKERAFLAPEESLHIFPNPNDGKFTVIAKEKIASIEVYDLSGRLVSSATVDASTIELNLESGKPGSYLVKVKLVSGSTYEEKLIRK